MPGTEGGSTQKSAKVKIVNEHSVETSLTCTCEFQPWACQACDFEGFSSSITEKEAVIRKRFRTNNSSEDNDDGKDDDDEDNLKTSDYDPNNGWLERDPETTQTFKRKQQVFNPSWTIPVLIYTPIEHKHTDSNNVH